MSKIVNEKLLVTGCAGFIGMHLCKSLLADGHKILGVDNLNSYYDENLKLERLKILKKFKNFSFKKIDISKKKILDTVFKNFNPSKVVNLAAQAGVRYSLENPQAYIDSNISGFINVLECAKDNNVKGVIYASSSSVYGAENPVPFTESDRVDKPASLYAATKYANELVAHTYFHLYNLSSTGLRFFTVYGPWGRPDMAYFLFTKNIINNKTIRLFNHGDMERDFTYIDDIIIGIKAAIENNFDCEIINLGNSKSENILDMVKMIQDNLGLKTDIKMEPMQMGDVKTTYADIQKAEKLLSFKPKTNLKEGLNHFIKWYKLWEKYS